MQKALLRILSLEPSAATRPLAATWNHHAVLPVFAANEYFGASRVPCTNNIGVHEMMRFDKWQEAEQKIGHAATLIGYEARACIDESFLRADNRA